MANSKFFFNEISTIKQKKIMLKESYIILTWFYYLRHIKLTSKVQEEKTLQFFVLPLKQQIYTLTQAPIAHKT